MAPARAWAIPPVAVAGALALALGGCGSGSNVTTTGGETITGPKTLLYSGLTSQQQPVRIEATQKMFGRIRLLLRCRDGSDSRVTLSTGPPRPTLQSDGSFYYEEGGRTEPAQFPGFGAGRYRGALSGSIVGRQGSGSAAFRITFRETSCRATVSWRVTQGGA